MGQAARKEAAGAAQARRASRQARHSREDTHRAARNFVVKQCFAIAKEHGLGQMDYRYRDGESGPQASLMTIGLHAVELDGSAPTDELFPDAASERAFLAAIAGKGRAGPGRMARDAIVPERERMAPPRGHGRG